MRAYEIILKKRDGKRLEDREIEFMIEGYTKDAIPDYQMAAFLMAVFIRGMAPEETTALTMAMLRSGDTIDLGAIGRKTVDKHSTGGVGDKTSLVLAPIVAASGIPIPMMSGRGLVTAAERSTSSSRSPDSAPTSRRRSSSRRSRPPGSPSSGRPARSPRPTRRSTCSGT